MVKRAFGAIGVASSASLQSEILDEHRSAMNPEKVILSEHKGIAFSTYHEVIEWELRAAIGRYFDFLWELHWKEQQGNELYLIPIEQHRLPIIILSCTLLECVINFYLCTKCDAKHFEKLERKSLFDKWTDVPKEFASKYTIPKDGELANDLRKLIDRRKVIIHSKPMINIDGGNQHQGNEPDVALDENEFVGRCATLPFRLIENLIAYDTGSMMNLWSFRTSCGSVANVFEKRNRRLKMLTAIPRKLILEIMGQGHDRETAITCALMIGVDRTPNEEGVIVLYPRMGQRVEIQPLKFFGSQNSNFSS